MTIDVIPRPVHLDARPGPGFELTDDVAIVTGGDEAAQVAGAVLAEGLARLSGRPGPQVTQDPGRGPVVRLRLTEEVPGPDADLPGGYRLVVGAEEVVVAAGDAAGLLHGAATLLQVARCTDGEVSLPAVEVVDRPRFGWRGLSLDLARRFHPPATVRAVVDVMAALKLNVLHLHLTDDQGWRLEVPSRPALTERSGGTSVEGGPAGFLTVADYGEIVAYAAARGITVVPEIDLPGHVNAAQHALPELTPSGEPAEPYTGIEVGFSRLHADLPATGPFLRDVLSDVAAMTPGPFLHIGGDEALTLEPDEYRRLVEAAAGHARRAGKRVVGWQEVATVRPGPGTVVQYWNEAESADHVVAAALDGTDVLLSPASRVYLDLKYDATTPLGLEWAGHVEVRDAYDWEPLDVLPQVPPERVLGVEAALWSETLATSEDLFHLLLPRLAAVAEVAWSPASSRDWGSFAARLPALAAHWDRAGLAWYRSPQVDWTRST